MEALLETTREGLYCPAGGFHVDPWEPVDRAVITHAHADHARKGCSHYLTSPTGAAALRTRLGDAPIQTLPYGEPLDLGGARLSLHPAGHLLGSAQVRVERAGEVWVVSGDYKTDPDPTCEPFEPVPCDVFLTESTFALPIYRWRPPSEVFEEIHRWWRANQAAGRTSVIFAYALGKAQRLLASLDPETGPIAVHGQVGRLAEAYREAGVSLPDAPVAADVDARSLKGRALLVAPPAAMRSKWLRRFGSVATAMASGWMQVRGRRRHRSLDHGFVLSDHADWDGLLAAIRSSGAEKVGVTHGHTHTLVRWLNEQGFDAWAVPTPYEGERELAEEATDAESSP